MKTIIFVLEVAKCFKLELPSPKQHMKSPWYSEWSLVVEHKDDSLLASVALTARIKLHSKKPKLSPQNKQTKQNSRATVGHASDREAVHSVVG